MKLLATISCLLFSVAVWSQGNARLKKDTTKIVRPKALIVVNGIPYHGDVATIDPNTIEQVSILKPDGAMALYGNQGVNGALIITTKGLKHSFYQYKLGTFSKSYHDYLESHHYDDGDLDYVVDGVSLGRQSPDRKKELSRIVMDVTKVDFTVNPSNDGTTTQATVTITTKQ